MSIIVALRRAESYDPEIIGKSVTEALDAAGFPDVSGKSILLKPNLLSAKVPEDAVTTHPEILKAVIRYAKAKGAAKIMVGDSPGFQAGRTVAQKSGILAATESEGAEWVDFSETAVAECPDGVRLKRFLVARQAVDADVLVSLAKLKTHVLMRYTGALKNLFGLIPGMEKSRFHMRFPDRKDFGDMLIDLASAVKPDFALMDGVVAMEGPGPGNGRPIQFGLVAASKNPVALDHVCARAMGYDPRELDYLTRAATRKSFAFSTADLRLDGPEPESFTPKNFELIGKPHIFILSPQKLPKKLYAFIKSIFLAHPAFSKTKCIGCSGCVKICPADALVLTKSREGNPFVRIDAEKCIRCYCCHEICPVDAIAVKRFSKSGKKGEYK